MFTDKLGQSLHSISLLRYLSASCILCGFGVHFASLHSISLQTICLRNVWAQTFCIFRTFCSAKRLEPNISASPNRFARTVGPIAVRREQARPGPGLARPAPPAGSGGAKKQKTEARGRKGGPHWSPVEILVGGRQPEPPNATVCLLPCCGQRSPPFTQCVTPHVLRQLRWLVCSSTNASSRSYPLLTYLRPQSAHGQRAPKALSKLLSAEEQGIVSFSSATATLLYLARAAFHTFPSLGKFHEPGVRNARPGLRRGLRMVWQRGTTHQPCAAHGRAQAGFGSGFEHTRR